MNTPPPPISSYLRAAPHDRPIAVLWADDPDRGRRLGATPQRTFRSALNAAGQPRSHWLNSQTARPLTPPVRFSHEPLADLDQLLAWATAQRPDRPGGWIGVLSYDLGAAIEPAAVHPRTTRPPAHHSHPWPLIELHRIDDPTPLDPPTPPPARGLGAAREGAEVPRLGPLRSLTGRSAFERDVARVVELIRRGDIFQANLTHQLVGRLIGSPREAFLTLADGARPWHGGYVELAGLWRVGRDRPAAVISASPELFLRVEGPPGARRVIARPMKGTRPGDARAGELDASTKDRAELTMIVDLMRNDLGRVCRLGSVKVEEARRIERHGGSAGSPGGVLQATATVAGDLRPDVGAGALLSATFPPGSITGAPKIRAMQIIDELEPVRRGPYCGSIVWIGDDGTLAANVAIRTAALTTTGRAHEWGWCYGVGAGIVADSDPEAEWRETITKAGILHHLGAQLELADHLSA